MPRQKTHADTAAKMRAYRERKRLELMTLQALADQVADLESQLSTEKEARQAAEARLAELLGTGQVPAEEAGDDMMSFDGSLCR